MYIWDFRTKKIGESWWTVSASRRRTPNAADRSSGRERTAAAARWGRPRRRRAAPRPRRATAKRTGPRRTRTCRPAGRSTKVRGNVSQLRSEETLKVLIATDDDGPYYWHIKSGTIQREPPENKDSSSQPAMNFQRQIVRETEVSLAPLFPYTEMVAPTRDCRP